MSLRSFERPGIALYCPECKSRVIYADQTWQLDSPGMQIPGGPGSAESSQSQGPVSSEPDELTNLAGEFYEENPPYGMGGPGED